jgi:hypothetical protein
MDSHESPDNGKVLYGDMASQGGGIGHNDLIAYLAVMGDMRIGHDKISMTQCGVSPSFNRGPVDSYKFSNNVFIPNGHPSGFPSIAHVLGCRSNGNEGK